MDKEELTIKIKKNSEIDLENHIEITKIIPKKQSKPVSVYIINSNGEKVYLWNSTSQVEEERSVAIRLDTKTVKKIGCEGKTRVKLVGSSLEVDERLLKERNLEDWKFDKDEIEGDKTFLGMLEQLEFVRNLPDFKM